MQKEEPDLTSYLNRKSAAEYLGTTVGVLAVWDSIKRYNLNPRNIGGMIYYHKDDLDKHLNRLF
jgi:hypothetical protein